MARVTVAETFLKKMVDRKIQTAIYTAPQVRGPSQTVFDEIAVSKKVCKNC